MKVLYMGTPDFAVGPLEELLAAGHQVVCVVTQPDKPKGRGKEMAQSPVKQCALRHGIPVLTPVKIKTAESVEELKKYPADIFVVAAFGQLLSEEILNMPRYGSVNIHASLLPKYRGAAPIQWSILDGEKETGITIMQMDKGLDTGDILLQQRVAITDEDTGESLFDKLALAGSRLIVEALEKLEKGEIQPQKQDDSQSCYAKMLSKELGNMDWRRPAVELERLVRGLNSWPSAYTRFQGKTLKIWRTELSDKSGKPGEVLSVERDRVIIGTGEKALALLELQLEGKKRMTTEEFLRGRNLQVGEFLG